MLPMTHAKRPAPLAPPAAATVTVTMGAPPGPTSEPPPTAAASASLSSGRPRAGLGRRPKILVVSPLSVGRMTLPVHEPEPASGLEAKAQQPSPAAPQPEADHPWQQRAQLERHDGSWAVPTDADGSQWHLSGNGSNSWVPVPGPLAVVEPLAAVESPCASDWHSTSSRDGQRHEGVTDTQVVKPTGSFVAEPRASMMKYSRSGCWRIKFKLLGRPLSASGTVPVPVTRRSLAGTDSEAAMELPGPLRVPRPDTGRTTFHDGSVPAERAPPGPSGRPILMSFVGESGACQLQLFCSNTAATQHPFKMNHVLGTASVLALAAGSFNIE